MSLEVPPISSTCYFVTNWAVTNPLFTLNESEYDKVSCKNIQTLHDAHVIRSRDCIGKRKCRTQCTAKHRPVKVCEVRSGAGCQRV